ncbi:MAG: PilN domain-containing protein [Sedimentisphaerales bacterium]|nr:PilN domain-containing protein [Sedimentisphaerales bacterium]
MKTLNLIPDEFCLHQMRRKRLRGWIILWLAVSAVLLGWSGFRYIFYLKESAASRFLSKQYQSIQGKLQSLAQSSHILQDPDAGLDLVNSWQNYQNIENILAYLTRYTPESVYFQELHLIEAKNTPSDKSGKSAAAQTLAMFNTHLDNAAGDAPSSPTEKPPAKKLTPSEMQHYLTLTIKAVAVRHNAVAEFYRIIQQCPYALNSKLIHTQRRQTAQGDVIYFEIQADICESTYPEVQYADSPSTSHF